MLPARLSVIGVVYATIYFTLLQSVVKVQIVGSCKFSSLARGSTLDVANQIRGLYAPQTTRLEIESQDRRQGHESPFSRAIPSGEGGAKADIVPFPSGAVVYAVHWTD